VVRLIYMSLGFKRLNPMKEEKDKNSKKKKNGV